MIDKINISISEHFRYESSYVRMWGFCLVCFVIFTLTNSVLIFDNSKDLWLLCLETARYLIFRHFRNSGEFFIFQENNAQRLLETRSFDDSSPAALHP